MIAGGSVIICLILSIVFIGWKSCYNEGKQRGYSKVDVEGKYDSEDIAPMIN